MPSIAPAGAWLSGDSTPGLRPGLNSVAPSGAFERIHFYLNRSREFLVGEERISTEGNEGSKVIF